jgi:hypothetical protein
VSERKVERRNEGRETERERGKKISGNINRRGEDEDRGERIQI